MKFKPFKTATMEDLTYEQRIMEARRERAESCYIADIEYALEEREEKINKAVKEATEKVAKAAEEAKKEAEKAKKEAILKIAANLKKQLLPILQIADITNLTVQEIEAL